MASFNASLLDEFVAQTDRYGGPNTAATSKYWENFEYTPSVNINESLDPFGDTYCQSQLALYAEISGRNFNQEKNEISTFPINNHIATANPYGTNDTANIADHFTRLGIAMKNAKLPPSPHILDMGAGWGLSSEFLAMLGAKVTAVDINPAFVELINRRQERHKLPITALKGSFDDYAPNDHYEAVFFYECLHHALRPWTLLQRLGRSLKPGGKVILAGEPIYDGWRHWGIRLDALSVYCIRKFGWFETGWSKNFISACLIKAGYLPRIDLVPVDNVGYVTVATKIEPGVTYKPNEFDCLLHQEEWFLSPEFAVARGNSSLKLPNSNQFKTLHINIVNYRPSKISLNIESSGRILLKTTLVPGKTDIKIDLPSHSETIEFISDPWTPAKELKNGDMRSLSFHISGLSFS